MAINAADLTDSGILELLDLLAHKRFLTAHSLNPTRSIRTLPDTEVALLADTTSRSRPSCLLEGLAGGALILEPGNVSLPISTEIFPVLSQVIGNFWCAAAIDNLAL